MTREEAARILGTTLARIAVEDAAEWAAAATGYLGGRHQRRYRFVDLEDRGGPPAVLGGQVMRRLPHIVQEAAGRAIRVYLCSDRVQVDPVEEVAGDRAHARPVRDTEYAKRLSSTTCDASPRERWSTARPLRHGGQQ